MAPLHCKSGVTPKNLWILAALSRVKAPVAFLVITAGTDGKHKVNSKHYVGDAVDVRSHNFPTYESKLKFIENLRAELGPGYTILLESLGKPNEHFHVQVR